MRIPICVVVAFLLMMSLGVPMSAIPDVEAAQPSEPFKSARDFRRCVLPMDDLRTTGILWGVSVQVAPAFEPEWMLTLKRTELGAVEAKLHEVRGASLFKRFDALSDTPGTCEGVKAQIPVTVRSWTSDTCRELSQLMKDFENQKWPARPSLALVFDATTVEARVETMMERTSLEIQSVSSLDVNGKNEHPLAAWVWRARRTLERGCTAK